jgi:SAM-dependent methyltransferase
MYYAEAPWLTVRSSAAANSLVWKDVPLAGNSSHSFEEQITDLQPFLAENWKARVSAKTGNPVYDRPVVLVLYRADHRFLLDSVIPRPGKVVADFDLIIASQPYRARASAEFKAQRVIAPLARALAPGGRLIGIHSKGDDPGLEIIQEIWAGDNPFTTDRHQILKAVKRELGSEGRDLNFNAYSDERSVFRYSMHILPNELSGSIGTSTLFAAWNAAIYVAQVEDDRLSEAVRDGRYIQVTDKILKRHGGLWFNDESYIISRRRP